MQKFPTSRKSVFNAVFPPILTDSTSFPTGVEKIFFIPLAFGKTFTNEKDNKTNIFTERLCLFAKIAA